MLSLNDIKPLGAFIENTIRPVLSECGDILHEFQRQGINVTQDNLIKYTKTIAYIHLKTIIIQAIRDVVIAIIIAGVLWTTSQS